MKLPFQLVLMALVATAHGQAADGPRISGPLSLQAALQAARLHSPSLAASAADVNASNAAADSVRSETLPSLSANGFGTSGSYSAIVNSSPNVMPPYSLGIPNGNFADANLMLMLPLFTGGLLNGRVGAAAAEGSAARAEGLETRSEVDLAVTTAYLRALLAKEVANVAQAKAIAMKQLVSVTQAQFEAGKGIEASVLRARAELAQANRSLASAQNDADKDLLDLYEAMGVDLSSEADLTDPLGQTGPARKEEEYLSLAAKDRGIVRAAESRLGATKQGARAARGEGLPQVYGFAMSDGTSRGGFGSGTALGLSVSFPVFDGGRTRADVAQARAKQAHAEAAVRDARLSVAKEVRQAWLDLKTAQSNTVSAGDSVAAAQSAYETTTLRVSAGKGILLEELDAIETLISARTDLAQAHFDAQLALAKLDWAAGIDPLGPTGGSK
jgi:outer membrane protein